ncbi:radical SAM protein [Verrucomicrobium spinosum]|uniref:radical SAM protein n=1 Tax=Verrucomicrobium spinosum TaxID=2736 RepID=UPI000174600C|nr:radical SAM protein [Verrucomicrobium spinosum]
MNPLASDSQDPLVVVWRVTERCNLRCPFCAYDARLERPRGVADPAEIRRFAAVLADWSQATGRPVLLSWLGGEPLLWKPLEALTRHCRDDLNLRLSTTTNGTTLHRAEVQAHLREYYTELTVSVDGPAALHDVLRGQAGLHDRLRTGVQALVRQKHLTGHGPLLRANVVLFRETVTAFPALCQSLADWRIEEITCNQLGGLDRPEYYPAHRLLPPQVDWLTARWPGWQQQLADQGVRLLGGAAYLHRLAMTAQGRHLPVADCQPGESFLFIDEAGRIAPCSYTPQAYGVPISALHTTGDLLSLPDRFRQLRRSHRAAACEDCHSTQVCAKFTTVEADVRSYG